ncbi:conserved hypothetical protein [Gloeothece citriformis PCC 7424]|uniref:PBP domain-containing protein n=1 Tax=Gloeothece citriformis (strain PCC 7424) TaxID=65393 RepID=B7KF20_GLOC7|nr:PstS family phosphate ABC transporter substrate-binding protein [Gloeothece citriformis]ACK70476.1 conserved hypothetical protein [Gloeothece citriformis PCC 7424]
MTKWTCNGIAKDKKYHPEQHSPGLHLSQENYGDNCIVCGLNKEAVIISEKLNQDRTIIESNKSIAPAAVTITGLGVGLLGAMSFGIYNIVQSQDISDSNSAPSQAALVSPLDKKESKLADTLVPKMNIFYGGSTSFAPIRPRQEWKEGKVTQPERLDEYIMQTHPDFKLVYKDPPAGEKPGSGSGIKMLLKGQLSFSHSSRPLKEEEIAKAKTLNINLRQENVALDGLAIYVNQQLPISGLTVSQLKDIYTGKITNWSQLGGPDLAIKPFSRDPEDGGTPDFFKEEVLGNDASFASSVNPYVYDTTDSIKKVAKTPGGIGYATASEVCPLKTVPIKALLMTKEDNNYQSPCKGNEVNQEVFLSGTYPITRRLFVIIKENGGNDQKAGEAYVRLLLTDEGQKLIAQSGLVPLRRVDD